MIARHEHLRDGFTLEPRLALDELIQQMAPESALGELIRDQLAHVLDVIIRQTAAISVDPLSVTRAGPAVAADQDKGIEPVRMIEPEQKRHAGADAASRADC